MQEEEAETSGMGDCLQLRVRYVVLSYQRENALLGNVTPPSREERLYFSSLYGLVVILTNWEIDSQQIPLSITSYCIFQFARTACARDCTHL